MQAAGGVAQPSDARVLRSGAARRGAPREVAAARPPTSAAARPRSASLARLIATNVPSNSKIAAGTGSVAKSAIVETNGSGTGLVIGTQLPVDQSILGYRRR